MLELVIPETEQYDEANDRFITTKKQVLRLEHSLVSLSKWESKWHKPYLSRKPKTREERSLLSPRRGPPIFTPLLRPRC